MTGLVKRLVIGATTIVVTAGTIVLSSGTANAADPDETFPGGYFLTAQYDASGTTHIANKNAKFDVKLGPTKLTADVGGTTADGSSPDLAFYASLPLPPQDVYFKAFGYLPVRAKVYFTQVGPATGLLHVNGDNLENSANAKYVVTLRDVIVGYSKANVGNNCQTRYPIDVNVSNPNFDLFGGGDLTGTYDLGKFNNCGTSTDLANLIVPSTGNTIKLHLSNFLIPDAGGPAAKKLNKLAAATKK